MDKRRYKPKSPETQKIKVDVLEYITATPLSTKQEIVTALNLTVNQVEFALKILRGGNQVELVGSSWKVTYRATGIPIQDEVAENVVIPHARVFKLSDREPSPEMREDMRQRRKQIKNTPYKGSSMSMFEGW